MDTSFKYISAPTPIKPAVELAPCGIPQTQTLGGIATSTAGTTLLRCAYAGSQLQVSTGLLPAHSGLQIVDTGATGRFGEKQLQLQQAGFPSSGAPPGLTVVSDSLQASSSKLMSN